MATIQTTQLEERETGDIKQLRDHDIAEGPVSTNSADATSLKSVPLTLEDGSIIKVRFDSLVTAIGQALGASEDSTVTKVLGLNGTVPKGIGMANLASVLGDTKRIFSGYFLPNKFRVWAGNSYTVTEFGLILVDYNGGDGCGIYFNQWSSVKTVLAGPSQVTITKPANGNNCIISVSASYANFTFIPVYVYS